MNIPINSIKRFGSQSLGRGVLLTKKFSPEILTTVGVIGVVAAAILASKATLKLENVVNKFEERADALKERKEIDEEYTDSRFRKDMFQVYTHGGIDLVKLYGPPVTLGMGSLACIIGAHGIIRQRNVALLAGYKALESSFTEYRKRVTEEIGEEKEAQIRRGIRVETVAENGKKVEQLTFDPTGISHYARFFDEGNVNWQRVPEYNKIFLEAQQNYANDMLLARGHIFLNEVYDLLGMEHSGAGAVCGWVVSKEGDNYVDFGIYDPTNEQGRAFVNGQERSILLDFNVDGPIFDKI